MFSTDVTKLVSTQFSRETKFKSKKLSCVCIRNISVPDVLSFCLDVSETNRYDNSFSQLLIHSFTERCDLGKQ